MLEKIIPKTLLRPVIFSNLPLPNEQELEILLEEIELVIGKLRNNKTSGSDRTITEILKLSGEREV